MEPCDLFKKHRPDLNDAEAANTIHFEGFTISFAARREADMLVLKLATESQPYRAVVLSRYAAECLRAELVRLGF
jgi:hypothetical protein